MCMMKKSQSEPTEKTILDLIGKKAPLWKDIRIYLSSHYDHEPVLSIGKKEYDWTIRYRKGGKTLVTLSLEKDGFCILVVLGKKEIAKVSDIKLNPFIKHIFKTARQYHDGRWLWIRLLTTRDTDDIKKLLQIKRKPKKK